MVNGCAGINLFLMYVGTKLANFLTSPPLKTTFPLGSHIRDIMIPKCSLTLLLEREIDNCNV